MKAGARLFGTARAVNPLKYREPATPVISPARRKLIAKVQIGKAELGLLDDDYRAILLDVAGVASAKDCSDADLVAVLERFKARGWKPALASGKKAAPRRADHPGAGKARALWISLFQLGVIDNPSDAALEAFAQRQIKGCTRLQWANQALVYKLIEALKAMADRAGWAQGLDGVANANKVITLKRRLVDRQLDRLREAGFVPAEWDVARASHALGGVDFPTVLTASMSQLDQAAQALGGAIRRAKEAGALK